MASEFDLNEEFKKFLTELLPVIRHEDLEVTASAVAREDLILETVKGLISGIGERVGAVDTWADRPTVDSLNAQITKNDTFRLKITDGDHPAGIYARLDDNSDWDAVPFIDFDKLGYDIVEVIAEAKSADTDMSVDSATAVLSGTEDGKFVTPKQVVTAIMALQNSNNILNNGKYHPIGGEANISVVAKAGEDGTDQCVVAKQLKFKDTQETIQAKMDAL